MNTPARFRHLSALACALVLAAPALTACSSSMGRLGSPGATAGPGTSCTTAEAETAPPVPGASSPTAAAAAARSGQDASSQPVQTDPARIAPVTTWNRGSGANVNAGTAQENRSQAGAPAVNQGLVFPANAMANANSPQRAGVDALQQALRQLLEQYGKATESTERAQLWAAVDATMQRLEVATAGMAGNGATTYNLQGARIVQVVANGSKSGDAPGDSLDPQNAKSIGEAAAKMIQNVAGAPEGGPPATGLAPSEPLPAVPAPAPAPATGTPR